MTQVSSRIIKLSLMLTIAVTLCGCAGSWPTWGWPAWGWHGGSARSLAIPDTYPLGSVNRAHYHTMQANAEAADFIIHRHEFVGNTAELTPHGKDHIVEIAARARSVPFPILIDRTENNSDPERDEHRRNVIVHVLTEFGVPEADQRTIVSTPYGRGLNSREAEFDYHRFVQTRGFGNFGGGNGNNGTGGGFGGSFGGGFSGGGI